MEAGPGPGRVCRRPKLTATLDPLSLTHPHPSLRVITLDECAEAAWGTAATNYPRALLPGAVRPKTTCQERNYR